MSKPIITLWAKEKWDGSEQHELTNLNFDTFLEIYLRPLIGHGIVPVYLRISGCELRPLRCRPSGVLLELVSFDVSLSAFIVLCYLWFRPLVPLSLGLTEISTEKLKMAVCGQRQYFLLTRLVVSFGDYGLTYLGSYLYFYWRWLYLLSIFIGEIWILIRFCNYQAILKASLFVNGMLICITKLLTIGYDYHQIVMLFNKILPWADKTTKQVFGYCSEKIVEKAGKVLLNMFMEIYFKLQYWLKVVCSYRLIWLYVS